MVDIILINPSVSDNPILNRSNIRPPLGLLNIAAPLVKNNYNVKIIDQRTEENWQTVLRKALQTNPFCVGISCMTGNQIKYALEVSEFIKDNSSIPVIWGGVHPTLEPISTIENRLIDVIIIGEGDYTFLEIVRAVESNKSLDEIRGIAFKKKNKIVVTPPSHLVDLNKLPKIPFHLINFSDYRHKNNFFCFESDIIAPMETSRGCSHRCTFCFQSKSPFNTWRAQSVERMISDVKTLVEDHNISAITFNEDNFFVNIKRGEDFSKALIKENLDIEWYALARPDTIGRISYVDKLEKSGLKSMTIGVESGSKKILSLIKKRASPVDFIAANRMLSKTNIVPLYCAIQGFPFETIEDLKMTYRLIAKLIKENKKCRVSLLKLIPTPSTEILDLCIRKGFKKPQTLEEWTDVVDTNYEKTAPWVDKNLEKWINKHKLFLKLLWLRNDKFPFSNFLFNISCHLI